LGISRLKSLPGANNLQAQAAYLKIFTPVQAADGCTVSFFFGSFKGGRILMPFFSNV
jgi:hypothetical protein